jgi:hypothetical protein
MGLDVTAEQMTNKDRIDMAVRLGGRAFILEFKVVEMDGDGRKALDQIRRIASCKSRQTKNATTSWVKAA